MYDNRYSRTDIIPMLEDDGVATTLAPLIEKNHSEEYLQETIVADHGIALLTDQLRQLIADLAAAGKLDGAEVASLPEAIVRTAAPSGLGCSGVPGTVWVTPPGEVYTLRFYVNGTYKLTLANYNSTDPATLGAVSGDIIRCCQVTEGIPGWWARIAVP